MTLSTPLYDENEDYIDENHINTFAKALLWEDDDHDGLASPPLPAYEGDKLAEVNAEELSLVLTPGTVLMHLKNQKQRQTQRDARSGLPRVMNSGRLQLIRCYDGRF